MVLPECTESVSPHLGFKSTGLLPSNSIMAGGRGLWAICHWMSHQHWSLQVGRPGPARRSRSHGHQGCARPTAPHGGRLRSCRPPPPFFPYAGQLCSSVLPFSFRFQAQLTFIPSSVHVTRALVREFFLRAASSGQHWAGGQARSRPQGMYHLAAESEPKHVGI